MNMLTRGPGSVLKLLNGIDFPYSDIIWGESGNRSTHPRVDIREEGDHFVLEAELPGVEEKDIDIDVDNSQLTIKANSEQSDEKESSKKEDTARYLLRERAKFGFNRSFALSDSVDTEKISASFKNGVLKVIAPKKEQERSKSIKIKAA